MRRVRKPINQINVVPYIDVMLVLLVIFMVTAPLITPGVIELPTVGSKLTDRKSTRLNSSHTVNSYAVFCLKKKNKLGKSRANDNDFRRSPPSRHVHALDQAGRNGAFPTCRFRRRDLILLRGRARAESPIYD